MFVKIDRLPILLYLINAFHFAAGISLQVATLLSCFWPSIRCFVPRSALHSCCLVNRWSSKQVSAWWCQEWARDRQLNTRSMTGKLVLIMQGIGLWSQRWMAVAIIHFWFLASYILEFTSQILFPCRYPYTLLLLCCSAPLWPTRCSGDVSYHQWGHYWVDIDHLLAFFCS